MTARPDHDAMLAQKIREIAGSVVRYYARCADCTHSGDTEGHRLNRILIARELSSLPRGIKPADILDAVAQLLALTLDAQSGKGVQS